ncbi:MAG TPA: biotin-dependent carboxyltransferase family protein [Longimicrobium sp.]|nr:biotin-dependent carboxyltransferase family protein [Longimicrobium sp.]
MIEVLRPGLLTTVQDLGRAGFRDQGVPIGGAADRVALRVANLLVGNPEGAAGLEMTLAGPRLHFTRDTLIALGGAEMHAELDGTPVGFWRPVRVRAGATLDVGGARAGCRAYLACAGGIDVPPVLGSRSTYSPTSFGGLNGRPLRTGDHLPVGRASALADAVIAAIRREGRGNGASPWFVGPAALPAYGPDPELLLIPGSHAAALTPEGRALLFGGRFRVSPRSDRMGCRLDGPALALAEPLELTSEGVAPGTVQLPPGGSPIVLGADGGTTGGYPRVGHVATVHHPLLAQLRPGDTLRFRETTIQEAHLLLRAREREIARLAHAIRLRAARI